MTFSLDDSLDNKFYLTLIFCIPETFKYSKDISHRGRSPVWRTSLNFGVFDYVLISFIIFISHCFMNFINDFQGPNSF